jgi:uncharacterized protein YbjT (DUF2867 family)
MILVTGATGFVGGALIKRLALERSFNSVVAVVRKKTDVLPKSVRQVQEVIYRPLQIGTPP